MVLDYNISMGGVDLVDMLIALYTTEIMVKKRWYLKMMTWKIKHILISAKLMGGYFIILIVISKQFHNRPKIIV